MQVTHLCAAEFVEGLEQIVFAELCNTFGDLVAPDSIQEDVAQTDTIQFAYSGTLRALLKLRTAKAVYIVHDFPISRPRALLGHENLHKVLNQIEIALDLFPEGTFRTLSIGAAGSDSRVMRRLKDELAYHTGLAVADDTGDLFLRIRPSPTIAEHWQVLTRLSPRPLTTRAWRACNYQGALNATVAHAMALLTQPDPADTFLNIACGSGTLLIERRACGLARQFLGFDIDRNALNCARTNIRASGSNEEINVSFGNARSLPLSDRSINKFCADLPFGQLVGSHEENEVLYPAVLREAARIAKDGAAFALITHEIRLMERLLVHSQQWITENVLRITLRGLHPGIYLLRRI